MNKKSFSLLAISVLVVVLVGTLAYEEFSTQSYIEVSTLMLEKTPFDLAETADYAIVGTVIDMKAIRVDMPKEGDNDRVFTEVTLYVETDVFGNYGKNTITFAILGGETEKLIMKSNVSPEFVIGEKVLVYIGEDPGNYTYQGRNYLLGHSQGALEVRSDGSLVDKFRETVYDKNLVISKSQQIKGSR